jgi:signal transduction histidine kinase
LINLLKIGISDDLKTIEAKRIYFVNVLSLLCFVTSIFMIIPYIIFDLHLLALICIVFSPAYLLCFNFNSRGKANKAKMFIFVTITINIFCLSVVLGNKVNMATFYLPLVVILFLLFDKDQKNALLTSIILVAICSIAGFITNSYNLDSVMHLKPEGLVFVNTAFNVISLFGTVFLTYVFVISSDVALKKLSITNKNLLIERDELYESTIQLNKTTKEQVDLNHLKTKLLSIISHDVRQPVNNVISVSEIMIQSKLTETEMYELGLRLKESSLNVYQMLDNLLTWSYSQMNGLHPVIRNIELKKAIDSEINKNYHCVQKKNITLHIDIKEEHSICFDSVMFEIVFRNIFNNAIKFSPTGSSIKIYSTKEDKKTKLFICDEGIGISDDLKKKLFLNDLSKSRYGTSNEKGAGVGLLLCKELIDANKAQVDVHNKQEKGTTFELTFPS